MTEHQDADREPAQAPSTQEVAVTSRVRVFPSTDREASGVIVDDFGEDICIPVDIGGDRIAEGARRWAVMLDDDSLVFVDSHQLVAE